jgi:hypothetical protein
MTRPTPKKKLRRAWVPLGLSIAALALVSRVAYRAEALGAPSASAPPALAAGELRAVTMNAWRLSDPARVPRLVEAIEHTGRSLAGDRSRPRGSMPCLRSPPRGRRPPARDPELAVTPRPRRRPSRPERARMRVADPRE